MREIKFRVWDGEKLHSSNDFDNINFRTNGDIFRVWLNGDDQNDRKRYILISSDHPLEQYTGLKDKNGKEIYEGDKVKVIEHIDGNFIDDIYNYYTVIFQHFGFTLKPNKKNCQYNSSLYVGGNCELEVIGNIHE